MNAKKKILLAGLLVLVLLAAMMPLSIMLSQSVHRDILSDELVKVYNRQEAYQAMDFGIEIEPVMEIEDIWALEDTRTEAEGHLVTSMKNGDAMLGFDAGSGTFYCTLGENNTESWPELNLSAAGEDNLRIAFADDYSYDYCCDAISQGYRYEMIAYTDTEYAYMGIVFTGLPLVSLSPDCHFMDITYDEDVGTLVSVSSADYDAVEGAALVHQRGGHFYRGIDKNSYRLEFHELNARRGDSKREVSLLGMPADTDWLLISSPVDKTAVRNQICWELWQDWNRESDLGVNVLESRLVELFVGDEYLGLYQLMQRIDVEKEIIRMGGDPDTDMVARKIAPNNTGDRPTRLLNSDSLWVAELRHLPIGMKNDEAFELMESLACMERRVREEMDSPVLSDEEFEREVLEHIDIEHLINYFLFFQAASLAYDNVFNNVYIWTLFDGKGGYRYYMSPWDMDAGFMKIRTNPDGSDDDEINEWMYLPMRILDLNIGNSREILWKIWNEKRATILEESTLYQRIEDMESRINACGAYLRETERWRGGAVELDLSEVKIVACDHQNTIESHMRTYWLPEGMQRE